MAVRSWWSSEVGGYLVAVAAVAAAVAARLILSAALSVQVPFFTFVLAVLVAAWHGGLKPGLLATGLGTVFGLWFFTQPSPSDWAGTPGMALTTTLFLVVGGTASSLCGVLHAARRRTEEKRRQLEQAEEQVRSVLNHIVDGIITINEDGTVQSLNPAAERLFGYSAAEVIGQNVKMLLPAPDNADSDQDLAGCLRTGQAEVLGVGREVEGRRKDGSTFPMDLAVSEFRLGQHRYFTSIVRDITERKRAEEEVRRLNEALLEADRRKDEFLATLAHELRNPLAPLRNAVELLRRAEGRTDLHEQARGMMERQLGLMVRLIDDLLDVSRITRGKLQLRKERVELAAVIRSAVEAARPAIEAQAHELTVTLPDEPLRLDADPVRLAQVVLNLLTNAAKYTEKGGRIGLSAERRDSEVVVSVRDTGIGISAEHLPQLFEMFAQVASALERSQGGLGIGLALVRGLVELHGGSVEARSGGPGTGSEFLVRLPVAEALAEAPPEPGGESEPARSGRPCRILVVDDIRDTADSLATLLGLMGHDVRTAHDGPEAIQAAATFHPNVVLLDIGLPTMNGYDAARRIRAQASGRTLVLIALTGWGQAEDKRRAQEAGFDHHLTKPVDPAALEKLLALVAPASQP
jgi:PAS domain S-box-containing protein